MRKDDKIIVTGSDGLLGSAIVRELKKQNFSSIFKINRKYCDLENKNQTEKIKILILNIYSIVPIRFMGSRKLKNKFKMINTNNIINSNLLNAVQQIKLKKIIAIGSSAGYPNLDKSLRKRLLKANLIPRNFIMVCQRDLCINSWP